MYKTACAIKITNCKTFMHCTIWCYVWKLKYSKINMRVYRFFLKTWSQLFIHYYCLFIPLNDNKIKLYTNVLEMFKFHQKTRSREYPIFSIWYNFFSANVSGSHHQFTAKSQKHWVLISLQAIKLHKQFMMMKFTCFKVLYNIFKFKIFWAFFFFFSKTLFLIFF
jgi:hypothetical protein